jgi:hypothetical protein
MNNTNSLRFAFYAIKPFLFLFLCILSFTSSAQTLKWLRNGTPSKTQVSSSATLTSIGSDGSIYVGGIFSDTIAFGTTKLVSSGRDDIYIVKYNSTGTVQWAKRAGGVNNDEIWGLVVSGSDVYIAGGFQETMRFDTLANATITSMGSADIFIAKYNTNGMFQWAKRAGGTERDVAYNLAVSGTDIYITGSFWSIANFNTPSTTGTNEIRSLSFQDIFIAKYNSSGIFQWAKRAGGGNIDAGFSITASGEDVYITGYFSGLADFNTPTAMGRNEITSANMLNDIFLAKYNSNGTFQWAKRAGGNENDAGLSVAVSGTDVYVTGEIENTANFNTPSAFGTNEITGEGRTDMFLAKFNSNGAFQWAKRAGGLEEDAGNYVVAKGTDVYVTGAFKATANFNTPSATSATDLISAGRNDMFVVKYNNNGVVQWTRRGGGTGDDIGWAVDASNTDVSVVGNFTSLANFNTPSNTSSNTIQSISSNTTAFIAVYSTTTPVEDLTENTLKIYPSVTNSFLTVETTELLDFQIINLLGQAVLNGTTSQQINVSNLPQGTYILKIGKSVAKFVKQ